MRSAFGRWLRRYGVAEVAGTITALAGAYGVRALTGSEIAAAYGGAIGENVGYYGTIVTREALADARRARDTDSAYDARAMLRTARNLVFEFGFAEVSDSLVIRPLAMGLAARWLGPALGVLVGKIAADLVFYVPVIASYELRRHLERTGGRPNR